MANNDYTIREVKHDKLNDGAESFFGFEKNYFSPARYFKWAGDGFVFCSCSEETEENTEYKNDIGKTRLDLVERCSNDDIK